MINCAKDAIEALNAICPLEHQLKDELIRYFTVTEQLAIEHHMKVSATVDSLKLITSNHYTKSKSADVLKLKKAAADVISKLKNVETTP